LKKIKKYVFSDLYDMSSGISSTKEQAGHGSPFISFSTVFNNYFLPDEFSDLMDTSENEQETYSVKEGDILLTRTSETIDELAMSCVVLKDYPKATYSGFTKRLRPKTEGIAYHKYLAFYLRGELFRKTVTNNAFMTLRASFNGDIFSFLNLYLPPYEEQVRIGELLFQIEQKIQLNRRIITEFENMVKTVYDYWFVQFEFPNEDGRPYKSSGGEVVWNDQFKKVIPKDWQYKKASDLLNVITGKEDANFATKSGEFKFFTCSQNTLLCDNYTFEGSAVLIAGNGDFNVKHYKGKFNAYQRTYILIPREEKYHALIYMVANSKINSFKKDSNGSIVKFITKDDVASLPIPICPNNRLYEKLNLLIDKIELLEKENEELTKLRNWLLPMLMNGQVSIV